MVWIAIAIQVVLSMGLLWAAWQLWMFRNALLATVETVDGWTKACEDGLQVSSPSLEIARNGVETTRASYQALQDRLERLRNLWSMLGRGVSFLRSRWQSHRRSAGSRSSRSKQNVKRRG
ncbi:MAG: hypothetical protein NW214_16485 [Pseudanabaenaceae cyanobacterium bins.39]|nr:hypothetical protein [Pseudanabaenaceae cyanobacterium bins.39]